MAVNWYLRGDDIMVEVKAAVFVRLDMAERDGLISELCAARVRKLAKEAGHA